MDENYVAQTPPVEPEKVKRSNPFFRKFINQAALLTVFIMFSLIIGYMTAAFFCKDKNFEFDSIYTDIFDNNSSSRFDFVKFSSEEEFKSYLANNEFFGVSMLAGAPETTSMMLESNGPGGTIPRTAASPLMDMGGGAPKETSGTNIQVEGVDEPDIVKATGKTIFTSFRGSYLRPEPLIDPGLRFDPIIEEESNVEFEIVPSPVPPPPSRYEDLTKIINAFPPEELELLGSIEEIGNLLYSDGILIVFTDERVAGYDVNDPGKPLEKWNIKYEDGSSYKDARLNESKLYLVTQTIFRSDSVCPISPVYYRDSKFNVECTDIYHPADKSDSNASFTVFKINPASGEIEKDITFVGSYNNSVIYMSEDFLYTTYSFSEDSVKIFSGFILEDGSDLFSEEFKNKIVKLNSYELSDTTKYMEFMLLLQEYLALKSGDDSLKIETEFSDRFEGYAKSRLRDFTTTGIVKIDKNSLDIEATGEVPGHPLNQFSLDEYDGYLRIATNVRQSMFGFGSTDNENDLYILDKKLEQVGSVLGMGVDERIYSARFIGDRGYIVTFRETDPFYVLDLSNPNSPELKGELKIPGYSSYLHPLDKNLILGIGKEDSNVKLSLFDVSDPSNPVEKDKYSLDEYWSEILNTHHAFMQDPRFKIFFIPGNKGGYIFSYGNGKLELTTAVRTINVQRALYMDDYLYLVGSDKINVLNEKTWDEVAEFDL